MELNPLKNLRPHNIIQFCFRFKGAFMSKLGLKSEQISRLRSLAKKSISHLAPIMKKNTTLTIERSILRLLGLEGVNSNNVPYANIVVNHLKPNLKNGVALYVASVMLEKNISINEVAEQIENGNLNLNNLDLLPISEIKEYLSDLAKENLGLIKESVKKRNELIEKYPLRNKPWHYVIVATGNIYEDVEQAKAAALEGADIIAVIRTTGQSLLDYVPYGATTEGFGGTYATQENFKIMRKALDEVACETGHYCRLVNYASGLCMPEIVVMGAFERLDMMLNDSMYGILFRDINPVRTFLDQFFSRMINAYAEIIINTGEDNYLTTADAVEEAHTVLASDLINESFGFATGLKSELLGLGHAFEIDPQLEDGFLLELGQALMLKEIFPNSPLKYMPPTKHMTGDIFKGYIMNALFNLAGVWSNQGIQLLGMLTEAMHTPFIQDRYLALQNAQYVMNSAKHIGDAVLINPDGIIAKRAQEIVDKTESFLEKISEQGLLKAIEEGKFADIKRFADGGKGLDGVIEKSDIYINPFISLISKDLNIEEDIKLWM
jgi:beta-lysine 5,6-aminomutase alpha subunit